MPQSYPRTHSGAGSRGNRLSMIANELHEAHPGLAECHELERFPHTTVTTATADATATATATTVAVGPSLALAPSSDAPSTPPSLSQPVLPRMQTYVEETALDAAATSRYAMLAEQSTPDYGVPLTQARHASISSTQPEAVSAASTSTSASTTTAETAPLTHLVPLGQWHLSGPAIPGVYHHCLPCVLT